MIRREQAVMWGRADAAPYAVILGTNEVASAAAVELARMGWVVVLAYDAGAPTVRRGMAFTDALFGDPAALAGIVPRRAASTIEIIKARELGHRVIVTSLGLLDLITIGAIGLLIDARLQPAGDRPHLRWLARLSIGLGAGFETEVNCDVAIAEPTIELSDALLSVAAVHHGIWRTPVDIGTHIYKGFILGYLHSAPIHAPIDGIIVGAVRDGTEVSCGSELVQIDAGVRTACWRGLDRRGQAFASAIIQAVRLNAAVRELDADGVR